MEKIVKRHLPWIQSHVHNKLGDFRRSKADTGDIVQEALIQFLKYGPRIRLSDDRHFRALLCRIIENVIHDKYAWFNARRRDIAKERPLPTDMVLNLELSTDGQASPSQIVQKQEEEAWARLGLEVLKPGEHEVIVLYHWEDLSFEKIGKVVGISKVGARKRYIRAMTLLAETVDALKCGRFDTVLDLECCREKEA